MIEFSFTKKEKEILKKLPLDVLVLFGSQAEGTAGKLSDYDFGVLPSVHVFGEERKKVYDALYDLLSAKIQQLVNIDIVFLPGASSELQANAVKHGVLLYERIPFAFARFQERVMDMYSDLGPVRRIFQKAILSRIP
ncbi:MAG: hypothetical protein A2940_01535 [Candidatus Wildermuthbacteria bacterium RIFCSPLOWO2_01_FULL_48_29]|uniref:Polymerase beta nucleotidyltransferase domain-containing protein n=2 Tax=Candidatus Wildermuthiibacteriota TaxID=1817923 RepID=A0A1G2RN52_9BACT|nr:MAG: hypothetical protein A2843_01825 [Candidatus Wildermuthbacteria bacterium RIFCSPHIGHO2_01_FULL_48_27b]OHA73712.1 MAG: hypothetical protein A2940_01535 [Candidatus Wildermuthbacteria bacterium RIFCSPLOWO2_01_FULL_48_29]